MRKLSMTDTASHSVPEQGKIRRALSAVGAFLQSLDYTSFNYTVDRIERLEREVGRLKKEISRSQDAGTVDALNANAPAGSNIDSSDGTSLKGRSGRAPMS
jgi:hypothetical protein